MKARKRVKKGACNLAAPIVVKGQNIIFESLKKCKLMLCVHFSIRPSIASFGIEVYMSLTRLLFSHKTLIRKEKVSL